MTNTDPQAGSSGPPRPGPPNPASAADTPLYNELAATLPTTLSATPHNPSGSAGQVPPTTHPAAAVLRLFARIKSLEESDGGWPGADVVDELTAFFDEFGIDLEADPAAAARSLRMTAHLGAALTAPYLREGKFDIHLHTENPDAAVILRSFLSALVHALGEQTSAAVFDHTGDQISHLIHPDDEPGQ